MKQNYRFSILGRTEMPPSSLEAFNCALNYLLTYFTGILHSSKTKHDFQVRPHCTLLHYILRQLI